MCRQQQTMFEQQLLPYIAAARHIRIACVRIRWPLPHLPQFTSHTIANAPHQQRCQRSKSDRRRVSNTSQRTGDRSPASRWHRSRRVRQLTRQQSAPCSRLTISSSALGSDSKVLTAPTDRTWRRREAEATKPTSSMQLICRNTGSLSVNHVARDAMRPKDPWRPNAHGDCLCRCHSVSRS
jgi:hypothetical protein